MPKSVSVSRTAFVLGVALLASLASYRPLVAQELSAQAVRQVQAILADKATWTPTERKLSTSLLMAHRQSRGRAMVQGLGSFPRVAARARVDTKGMVVVDIKGVVTESLLRTIADVGGKLMSSHPSYGAVRARVPVRRVDAIAALPEVRYVGPPVPVVLNTGSVTSEGDVAHAVAAARTTFGIDGTGVRVGVLSDGVDSLAARQATGDLPPTCTATPGPGACVTVVQECDLTTVPPGTPCGDEGTAMLEVVHDLAPGARLFFATAGINPYPTASDPLVLASNILTLRNTYGCDVIVDDVTYSDEPAFQDGPIAQAVNAVKASGALYFSAAGNAGRLDAGTSGTWEGDFVDSGTTIPWLQTCAPVPCAWASLPIHTFNGLTGGSAANSDPLTSEAPYYISLQWSNPWGGATDDYDIFLFDSTLSILWDWSDFFQVGCPTPGDPQCSSDPFEIMDYGNPGERIVVVKFAGVSRALRVDAYGGQLSFATAGAVFGHNGGASAISVAATDVASAGGGAFTGGAANPVETYSSDGPRRMFFNPDGSAITPGNVLFGTNGGRVLQKPDVTAADCVTISTPGFSPFCGTSAAAPHAAAIAALLKSAPLNPSGGQALAALFGTALDVNPPAAGRDRDSGVGIVMANGAASALIDIPNTAFYTLSPCRVFDTRVVSGPTLGAPLTCGTDQSFTIVGGTCGVPASAKAVSLNVTVPAPTAQGNVRLYASGAPAPLVSNLNYVAGVTRANNAVAPLSAGGQIAVLCSPSGTAHVIVDVNGYFQ